MPTSPRAGRLFTCNADSYLVPAGHLCLPRPGGEPLIRPAASPNASPGEATHMQRSLIALGGVVLTLAATVTVVAYQHATGGGNVAAAAPASAGSGSGSIVVDWNQTLVKIVNTPVAHP